MSEARILIWMLIILCVGGIAVAQDVVPADVAAGDSAQEQERPTRRGLMLALAKVCANEVSLQNEHLQDCALIWQVTEGHSSTITGRLSWLQRHSRKVLGDRHCPEGRNCQWSRNLEWNDEEPEGWIGPWTDRQIGHWRNMRRYSANLVTGRERFRPCDQRPYSWGSDADFERARRQGRSIKRLNCIDTLNHGLWHPWGQRRDTTPST